jgi:hypothetical protein
MDSLGYYSMFMSKLCSSQPVVIKHCPSIKMPMSNYVQISECPIFLLYINIFLGLYLQENNKKER